MASLKYRWRAIRPKIASGGLYVLVRIIGATLRTRSLREPADLTQTIVCGWHGRTFSFANHFRNRDFSVIISHSNDGDIQTSIFRRLGFNIIRGSTGRGGVKALVEAIRCLRAGGTMAMTPDGPRGPSGVVQEGVMVMAQKSGAKLLPGAFSCRPRLTIRSWDKYIIPLPFAKAVLCFGDPIIVPANATADEIEVLQRALETEMHRLEIECESIMGYNESNTVRSIVKSA